MLKADEIDLPALAANETLSARAAQILRDAIIRGTIPAGQSLRLDKLAQQFGISRIPLRDAVRQLEKEGFVSVTPYRGARVQPLSVDEGKELCQLSSILHSAALRGAFPHHTDAQLDRAESLFKYRLTVEDPSEWRRVSDEFLQTFYSPGNKPLTVELIRNVTDRALRYWHALLKLRKAGLPKRASFLDVIDACRRRDLDEAQRLIAEAHRGSEEAIEAALSQQGEKGE